MKNLKIIILRENMENVRVGIFSGLINAFKRLGAYDPIEEVTTEYQIEELKRTPNKGTNAQVKSLETADKMAKNFEKGLPLHGEVEEVVPKAKISEVNVIKKHGKTRKKGQDIKGKERE